MSDIPQSNLNITRSAFEDDARLTAFALGELAADEAADLEARLANDAVMRREVASIRATASALQAGYAQEPVQHLTQVQRSTVLAGRHSPLIQESSRRSSLQARQTSSNFMIRSRWIGRGLAAAAVLALAVTATIMSFNDREQSGEDFARTGSERVDQSFGPVPPSASVEAAQGNLRSMLAESPGVADAAHPSTANPNVATGDIRSDDHRLGITTETTQVRPDANEGPAGGSLAGGGRTLNESDAGRGAGEPMRRTSSAPAGRPETASGPPAGNQDSINPASLPAESRSRSANSPERDADQNASPEPTRGAASGLRDPARRENTESSPSIILHSPQQIAAMNENEVNAAINRVQHERAMAQGNGRRESQLQQQLSLLNDRLRQIDRANAEAYSRTHDNPFIRPRGANALSWFPALSGHTSFDELKSHLLQGRLPPANSVRIEELLHALVVDDTPMSNARDAAPFAVQFELGSAPWNPRHQLLKIDIHAPRRAQPDDGQAAAPIAHDARFQVEFNPAKVGAFRLIGYEDPSIMADGLLPGHSSSSPPITPGQHIIVLYEIAPPGVEEEAVAKNQRPASNVELEYQRHAENAIEPIPSENLLTLRINYREAANLDHMISLRIPFEPPEEALHRTSTHFRFAAAVAEFGMLLRRSPYVGGGTFDHVIAETEGSIGDDPDGRHAEFIDIVKKARAIEHGE